MKYGRRNKIIRNDEVVVDFRRFPFRRVLKLAGACGLVISFSPSAFAQIVTMKRPGAPGGIPQIIGGEKQERDRWPATREFLVGGTYCTATIVGARAVLVAAHCIQKDSIYQTDRGDGQNLTIECKQHPHFRRTELFADVAMCIPKDKKEFSTNFQYENIDLHVSRVQTGQSLFLLGFGCRKYPKPGEAGGVSAGQLYGGLGAVFSLPTFAGGHILTRQGVAICPGDSGGAAYVLMKSDDPGGARSIVGVNSGYRKILRESKIAGFAGFVGDFIKDWASDYGIKICGVDSGADNCREKFIVE